MYTKCMYTKCMYNQWMPLSDNEIKQIVKELRSLFDKNAAKMQPNGEEAWHTYF